MRPARASALWVIFCLLSAISTSLAAESPSDDANDYQIDSSHAYRLEASPPFWVVPGVGLPKDVTVKRSNNNVSIAFHEGRLFMAWRSGKIHFATKTTYMYILVSDDLGRTWTHEHTIALGTDVREPGLLSLHGRLHFYFFEAGTDPLKFEPKHLWHTTRYSAGQWSALELAGDGSEVPWEVKVRGGRAWRTSYIGNHYDFGKQSSVEVHFKVSDDGIEWRDVDPNHKVLYRGGVSEVAWEFDVDGSLWAVTRNEDGDKSGFGSHVAYAAPGQLGEWQFPKRSNPYRYDSPRMFRHGRDLYLVARRDVDGPYDYWPRWFPFIARRALNMLSYWGRPKRTAVYQIDKATRKVVWLFDLPSAGDTAFPSIARLDAHRFLVANYTSDPERENLSWIEGQLGKTAIYFTTLTFTPEK